MITGGTSGIGLEFAAQFLALGNKVIVTGRTRASIDAAAGNVPGICAIQSDVSRPKDIVDLYDQILAQFPTLNVLINNAGIMRAIDVRAYRGSLEDTTDEVETNLNGTIHMVLRFLPHLMTRTPAAIVNVSSGLAFVPLAISPVYCASKAAIHSFTQSLRVQLQSTNVSVFELVPPRAATQLYGSDFSAQDVGPVKAMEVQPLVKRALEGLARDRYDIRPGASSVLSLFGRIAPNLSLRALNRRTLKRLCNSNTR